MTPLYRFFKKYHKWLGIVLATVFIFFALSGIVMNHRKLFSSVDVGRSWLPSEYQYVNWNNAALRGAVNLTDDSLLVYGNIGIWKTDSMFHSFVDFNQGFSRGIDNRKISDVIETNNGTLFAGTMFGLFRFSSLENQWKEVELPSSELRIVGLEEQGDSLIVMTRSYVLVAQSTDNYTTFTEQTLLPVSGKEKQVSLFRTIWVIHSGEIWGLTGKLLVDLGGIVMILLSITGIVYFIAPKRLKRSKERVLLAKRLKKRIRWSYKWHLKVGIISSFVLLIVMLTGMFLRPPLLIPIASKQIAPIKGTTLNSSNYWSDNLRDIIYDSEQEQFLISTSDGIFKLNKTLDSHPHPYEVEPPVSVMGINVFRKVSTDTYLVGSFSGLFLWNPAQGTVVDYITGKPVEARRSMSAPFGNISVAGYLTMGLEREIVFDYGAGAISSSSNFQMPSMPLEIVEKSGMSLWNLALEVHTWRILNFMIGGFYILVVPLSGILGLILILSGAGMWFIRNRKQKRCRT